MIGGLRKRLIHAQQLIEVDLQMTTGTFKFVAIFVLQFERITAFWATQIHVKTTGYE